jgi:hypothetical protein
MKFILIFTLIFIVLSRQFDVLETLQGGRCTPTQYGVENVLIF